MIIFYDVLQIISILIKIPMKIYFTDINETLTVVALFVYILHFRSFKIINKMICREIPLTLSSDKTLEYGKVLLIITENESI